MMNKVNTAVAVLVNGRIIADELENYGQAEEAIIDYIESHPCATGDDGDTEFSIMHYIPKTTLNTKEMDFKIATNPGSIDLCDEHVGSGDTTYRIEDGDFEGQEFPDVEELQDFFREKIKDGMMTLEDVQGTVVKRIDDFEVSFDDAEQDDPEYAVELLVGELFEEETKSALGAQYVLASEVKNTEEAPRYVEQFEPTHVMTNKELVDELAMLTLRVADLQREQNARLTRYEQMEEADTF